LSSVLLKQQTLHLSGQVYSGNGVWAGTQSGGWTDWNNWTALGGRPGLDGALSRNTDSASLTAGSAALVVALPEQTLELQSLTLAGAGGVTLSGTAGSSLTLGAAGTLGTTVTVSDGTHTVAAPVSLTSPAVFNIGANARLTISGSLTGGASASLTKEGEGTIFLAQGYTYSGPTFVNAGKLELGMTAGTPFDSSSNRYIDGGTRQITLGAGARLVFIGLTRDLKLENTVIVGGDELVTSAIHSSNVDCIALVRLYCPTTY
jgi:autotransporter-associated beta strand protein